MGVSTDVAFHESKDHEVEPIPTTLSLHSQVRKTVKGSDNYVIADYLSRSME